MMTSMGARMSRKEFNAMAEEIDTDGDGFINYKGISIQLMKSFISFLEFCSLLCPGEAKKNDYKMKKSKDRRSRIQEETKDDYSSRNGSFSQG